MQVTLSEAFTYLLSVRQRNFHARVVSALSRCEEPGLGTMAVGLDSVGRMTLYYDPEFIAQIDLQELVLTLQHEVYHLILDHIPRYLAILATVATKEEKRRHKAVMNVAADCAANELIRAEAGFDAKYGAFFYCSEEHPRGFVLPQVFNMPDKKPYELYHRLLLKQMKKKTSNPWPGVEMDIYSVPQEGAEGAEGAAGDGGKEPGDAGGGGKGGKDGKDVKGGGGAPKERILEVYFNGKAKGAHSKWDAGDSNAEELEGLSDQVKQQARSLLQQAVREQKRSRGTVPAGIAEILESFFAEPKIPWPRVLRNLCTRTRQTKLSRGMSRPSRRMHGIPDILPYPGRARDNRFTIWFALDTSGSMSTEDCALGLRELLNIVRTEREVTLVVLYCDAALHTVYDVEKEEDVDFTIVGRGGTDFNPPFELLRKMMHTDKACDVLAFCTDGYAPAPRPENRIPVPVIWLITPTGVVPSPDYGIHIRMEK